MYLNKLKNISGPRLVISMELYGAFSREERSCITDLGVVLKLKKSLRITHIRDA